MKEDMSDMMKKVSTMLNKGEIPDNIKKILSNVSSSQEEDTLKDSSKMASSNDSGINPEMIQNVMNMFNSSKNTHSSSQNSDFSSQDDNSKDNNNFNIDMETILKLKMIMEKMNDSKNDPRSNLLLSLKPYLKDSRKGKVEQYVQLLNMTKVFDLFNMDGGGKAK